MARCKMIADEQSGIGPKPVSAKNPHAAPVLENASDIEQDACLEP